MTLPGPMIVHCRYVPRNNQQTLQVTIVLSLFYYFLEKCGDMLLSVGMNSFLIQSLFYAPTSIDRRHVVLGPPVCPSVRLSVSVSFSLFAKTFALAIAFECDGAFIFHIYIYSLGVKPFFYYQSQGHWSRSRLHIKVTVFEKKMAVAGELVLNKHSLFLVNILVASKLLEQIAELSCLNWGKQAEYKI